ncbi:MAG: hypothetical protein D3921_10820 [Candidatus Electrothrix sp. AW1]|nr:hypothetical protein [Candidatus Electrothrix sp. AX1]MCI5182983.1 hypothetical protein [Candidatus Electrothrix gigas]
MHIIGIGKPFVNSWLKIFVLSWKKSNQSQTHTLLLYCVVTDDWAGYEALFFKTYFFKDIG